MTVGPLDILDIAKDPRSVLPLYELEMRLNELIENSLCPMSPLRKCGTEQGEPAQTI
jgi:hypothetical protein